MTINRLTVDMTHFMAMVITIFANIFFTLTKKKAGASSSALWLLIPMSAASSLKLSELTLFLGQTKFMATKKNDLKTRWTALYSKGWKDYAETGERGRDTAPSQKAALCTVTQSREGSYQAGASPKGAKGWYPTPGTPTPGNCTREKSLQNVWLRKPRGLMCTGP